MDSRVTLIYITPNPEAVIARAARVSYRSEPMASPENDIRLIRKLVGVGHHSVLEHAVASFLIEGCSRVCMAQFTRHRLASYTVESMRFVDVEENGVVVPPAIAQNVLAMHRYTQLVRHAQEVYRKLRALGIRKEDARFALPLGTKTRLVVTANFREWLHIIELRTAPAAQWEIRGIVGQIKEILARHAPNIFGGEDG